LEVARFGELRVRAPSSVSLLLSIHSDVVLPPTRLRGVKGPPALTNILIWSVAECLLDGYTLASHHLMC
jgi:hypothetical protein